MVVSVSVVFSHDGVADWELWLAAVSQEYHAAHHEPRKRSKLEV